MEDGAHIGQSAPYEFAAWSDRPSGFAAIAYETAAQSLVFPPIRQDQHDL